MNCQAGFIKPLRARYQSVAQLLEQHRRDMPAKQALVDVERQRQISFAELAHAVDSVAVQLIRHGLGKGSRALLLSESSIEKIIAWLALWRIGAVVCPLDPFFYRSAALATVQTMAPDIILADAGQQDLDLLREVALPTLFLQSWGGAAPDDAAMSAATFADDLLTFDAPFETRALDSVAAPAASDLACLSCTSGTSGIPKVVAYDHHAYWENGQDSIDLLGLEAQDRSLEYRSLDWFSAQILSLMPFLQCGLTLHLARKFSYRHFPDWIASHRISFCAGVPAVINILLNQPLGEADGKRLSSLRRMSCSTAPLAEINWAEFEKRYGIPLVNLYGSSETGWICGNRYQQVCTGTVGRALDNVEIEIRSRIGASCPDGSAGQVIVSSDKIALGYLQADGQLHALRGAPLAMRDIAMRDADGCLRIIGRIDDLISRGGAKIAPAEIEAVLLSHPDVAEAAVIGVADAVYGQQPICFVVARAGRRIDPGAILRHCASLLPREKLPQQVLAVAALPRNPRGKLIRAELVRMHRQAAQASDQA